MKESTKRTIVRWIHIILTIPIVGYIYSPFEVLPSYAPPTRYIFLPTMALSGLWMWKGHLLRRLVARRTVWDCFAANAIISALYRCGHSPAM
jgi:hypothetical protein